MMWHHIQIFPARLEFSLNSESFSLIENISVSSSQVQWLPSTAAILQKSYRLKSMRGWAEIIISPATMDIRPKCILAAGHFFLTAKTHLKMTYEWQTGKYNVYSQCTPIQMVFGVSTKCCTIECPWLNFGYSKTFEYSRHYFEYMVLRQWGSKIDSTVIK